MTTLRAAAALTAAAVAGLTVVTLGTPASAAEQTCPRGRHYAPGAGCVHNGMSFDHRNFCPGQPGSVKVVGFLPGSTATITFAPRGKQLGTFTVGADQVGNGTFTIPAGSTGGVHKVTVSGTAENGKPTSETRTLRVVTDCAAPADATAAPAAAAAAHGTSADQRAVKIKAVKASAAGREDTGLQLAALGAGGLLLSGAGPVLRHRRRRTQ